MTTVYLDHNATAPVRPEAAEAMLRALSFTGNASSIHAAGRAVRSTMEDARAAVGALIAAPPQTVVFTSGGTEANALAINSAVAAGARRLIVSAIEHSSVIETARASVAAVEFLPVTADGLVDLDWLAARLERWDAADGKPFVAIMMSNNETGVIQPVAEAARLVRAADGWLHVDAIQAAGKVGIDSRALGADTLSVSAHKIGGPQGVGALTFGPRATISRQQHGGGHERGWRSGTENIPGIVAFGAAARSALRDLDHIAAKAAWRDAAAEALKAYGAIVAGEGAPRVANTLCIATPGFPSELQVMNLDLAGVMISAGSACSSGKVKPSHVLTAMGIKDARGEDLAGCALRVSGGWSTTEADWTRFVSVWSEVYERHTARKAPVAAGAGA